MDIVEQLRTVDISDYDVLTDALVDAADEIESLRRRLQDGSPVVEATIQHMALRITELEAVIKSHGIPVKSMSGGVAHYCTKEDV